MPLLFLAHPLVTMRRPMKGIDMSRFGPVA
jgi:hypothetical protein